MSIRVDGQRSSSFPPPSPPPPCMERFDDALSFKDDDDNDRRRFSPSIIPPPSPLPPPANFQSIISKSPISVLFCLFSPELSVYLSFSIYFYFFLLSSSSSLFPSNDNNKKMRNIKFSLVSSIKIKKKPHTNTHESPEGERPAERPLMSRGEERRGEKSPPEERRRVGGERVERGARSFLREEWDEWEEVEEGGGSVK